MNLWTSGCHLNNIICGPRGIQILLMLSCIGNCSYCGSTYFRDLREPNSVFHNILFVDFKRSAYKPIEQIVSHMLFKFVVHLYQCNELHENCYRTYNYQSTEVKVRKFNLKLKNGKQ